MTYPFPSSQLPSPEWAGKSPGSHITGRVVSEGDSGHPCTALLAEKYRSLPGKSLISNSLRDVLGIFTCYISQRINQCSALLRYEAGCVIYKAPGGIQPRTMRYIFMKR